MEHGRAPLPHVLIAAMITLVLLPPHGLIIDSSSRVINYLRVSMYKHTRWPTTRIRDRLQSSASCLALDVDQD